MKRLYPVVLLVLGVWPAALAAQQTAPSEPAEPAVSPGEPYYEQARDAYRHREYDQALQLLVQAVQADPRDPRFAIGAARAANYAGQLDVAVLLYDAYLARFPDHAQNARRRDDRTEAIQRERNQANDRRETPAVAPALPPTQTAALAALRERIASGPMMAPDGSGAYALYQTLLRTGYALPDLADLRDQLANGILAETSQLFYPTLETPYPAGDLVFWEQVPRRYEAVEALGRPVLAEPMVQARVAAAEGQRALINGNGPLALERFAAAAQLDPDLLMAHIGQMLAWHAYAARQGCCAATDVQAVLDRVTQLVELQAPQHRALRPILEGMTASDRGDHATAAARLIQVLAPEAGDRGAAAPEAPETPVDTPAEPAVPSSPEPQEQTPAIVPGMPPGDL